MNQNEIQMCAFDIYAYYGYLLQDRQHWLYLTCNIFQENSKAQSLI